MAKPVLAAEANRIRRLGSSWAAMAKAADVQRGLLAQAEAKHDAASRTGAVAERLRAYLSELSAAAVTMSAAYSRAAAQATRAAAAAAAASAAEQSVDLASTGLAKADAALNSAEAAVVSANVTVATHRAAGAISILIGMNIGPSPAQFATLAHAERRLVQAAHRDAARWVLGNAKHVLAQTEQERHRATRSFAAVWAAEAQRARSAVPEVVPQSRLGSAPIGVLADGLAALASVAAGQAQAIDRFAQGDDGAADGALEIVDSWAKRLARFGRAGEFAAPVIEAAVHAFAEPTAL